jgi:NADH dehydrogenase
MSALGTAPETREWTSYFRAKWEEEQLVQASGIPYVIFRPSFVFAPDGGLLGGAIRAVRYSPVVPMVTPERRMQPAWGEDVGTVFAQAVNLDAATNRTFDVVGPDVVTWAGLWDRIERVLGKRRANVRVPLGVVRAAAAAGTALPKLRNARQAVAMLDSDNVGDLGPLTETFDVTPLGLTEQIRRSVSAAG